MNENEIKELKKKLKELSKNDLVRMVLKSATMVSVLEKVCSDLKEENDSLKKGSN